MQLQQHEIQVRWSDLDGLEHVNHSAVLVYLEVGRDAFFAARGISPDDYVVRHCVIDYRSELRPAGSHLRYRCIDLRAGTTSITLAEVLLDDRGAEAVTATFTLVMWDRTLRTSRKLTDIERGNLIAPRTQTTEVQS
jgi:acyl-CoA thioesterase FadM